MALLTLPITNDTFNYQFRTVLDDVVYTIEIRYNERINRWILSLSDSEGVSLVTGKIILLNGVSWINFKADNIPKGFLLTLNVKDSNIEPELSNFGKDVLLTYIEAV